MMQDIQELTRRADKTSKKVREKAAGLAEGEAEKRAYLMGFADALDDMVSSLKRSIEVEKIRQKLAKLEREIESQPETFDLSNVPRQEQKKP